MDSKVLTKYLNKLTVGDCIDLLEGVPSESIDVCFADPPFNLKKKYASYSDNLALDEYLNWCERWLLQLIRILKPSGSLFIHNIPKWLVHYASMLSMKPSIHFNRWIAWDALSGANSTNLYPAHYGILYYSKDVNVTKQYKIRHPHKRERTTGRLLKDWGGKKENMHPFGPLVTDVWTDIYRVMHTKFKDKHPCQLPIHLLQRIILMSSDEHDVILDPFMGTGTTAIAAKSLGRNFIGFELNQSYVEIANQKLAQVDCSSKIADCWISYYNGDVITLRDKDWERLEESFIMPPTKKMIEFEKLVLNNSGAGNQLEFPFYVK